MDDHALLERLAAVLQASDGLSNELRSDAPFVRRLSEALADLAPALPILTERLARVAELEREFQSAVETAKLDALKEFAYGASHEINNPLANISARAQTLLQDERDPERRRRLAAINSQAFRAHEMIADVMLFARPPRMDRRETDLGALIESVLDESSENAASQHTQFIWTAPAEPIVANVDPVFLRIAVKALVANALEALAEGGRIEVELRSVAPPATRARDNGSVECLISDTGPGIPPHVRPFIFDPFFSGREAGRGLGMGLPKCWRIVREHGGRIDVESAPDRGARFKIALPR